MKKTIKFALILFCLGWFLFEINGIARAIDTESEGYWVPVGQSKDVTGQGNCMKVTNNTCPGAIFVPTKTAAEWTGDASKGFLTHVPPCASVSSCVNCDADGDSFKNNLGSCNDCDYYDNNFVFKQFRVVHNTWQFITMAKDPDNNLFITDGYSTYDKFDCSGNLVFRKGISGLANTHFEDINRTSDGNYIAVGQAREDWINGSHAFIAKINSSGNLLWAKIVNVPTTDTKSSLFYRGIQTSDGGYLAVGYSYDYKNSSGGHDGLIVKFNSSGQKTWAAAFGSDNASDYLIGVAQEDANNFIFAGEYEDTLFALKINDSSGSPVRVWSKTLGSGGGNTTFTHLIKTSDNQYVASGMTYGDYLPDSHIPPWYNDDAIIVKFNASGVKQWSTVVGDDSGVGIASDVFYKVRQTNDGGYLGVGGSFDQAMMAKFNSSGQFQWAKDPRINGTYVSDVVQVANDHYMVIGNGSYDIYDGGGLIRMGEPSGNELFYDIAYPTDSFANVTPTFFESASGVVVRNKESELTVEDYTSSAISYPPTCQPVPGCN